MSLIEELFPCPDQLGSPQVDSLLAISLSVLFDVCLLIIPLE